MVNGITIANTTGGRAINLGVNEAGAYNYIQSAYVNNADVGVNLAFFTGASERMRITSGGNVSIGTSSAANARFNVYMNDTDATYTSKIQAVFGPSTYLDSDATNQWGGGTSETQFTVGSTSRPAMLSLGGNVNTAEGMGVINFFRSSNTDGYRSRVTIWTGVNTTGTANQHGGYLAFSTAADGATSPTERMRITSAGLVAIGNTSPSSNGASAVIDVGNGSGGTINLRDTNTGIAAEGFHQIYGGDNRMYLYAGGSGASAYMQFYTNDSERMRITSGGNVGIGTTSPGAPLAFADSLATKIQFNGSNANGYTIGLTSAVSGGDAMMKLTAGSGSAGEIAFANTSTRMFITSGGTVYINTTSNPLSNATPQLGIIAAASTDAVSIKHNQNGNNIVNIWQTGTSSAAAIVFYKGDSQGGGVGNINITTSGTTYNSTSDYRLKENIIPLQNGIDRLMQLKPSKFNWIETGHESEGFIAHELQEIFPDAVTGEKDAVYSSTGNIKPQSVDYGRITPLLVKALQEQQAQIQTLTARLQELENK
jgi:hypothetical protein